MQIIHDVTRCTESFDNLVLTIGSFDGFHRGHRFVLEEVCRIARDRNGTAGLMTLWPHPRSFFHPETCPDLLTPPDIKEELLEAAGLDAYFVLPFNADVAHMDRETFLQDIVLDKCGARCLVTGHDFSFGAGARGDFAYLSQVAESLQLDVVRLPPLTSDVGRISSTQIRDLVKRGDLEKVHELLGRPYALRGPVIQGRGLGRGLGFPTANIAPPANLLPPFGIYAARVTWDGHEALGAVNIGLAPTLQHAGPMIEVHLLDTEANLVGRELTVSLYRRLRGEKKFDDLDSLKCAIQRDIDTIRRYFDPDA